MQSISALQTVIKEFCAARDWDQFHGPKDLAIGVSTEAAELLELFRFKTESEIKMQMADPEFREKLSDELADVFFFVLRLAQRNEVDLVQAFNRKMEKNAAKYPVDKARGSNKKYTEY